MTIQFMFQLSHFFAIYIKGYVFYVSQYTVCLCLQ